MVRNFLSTVNCAGDACQRIGRLGMSHGIIEQQASRQAAAAHSGQQRLDAVHWSICARSSSASCGRTATPRSGHAWVDADQSKNRRPIAVPLNSKALKVLRRQIGKHPVRVFAYAGRPREGANTHAWQNALERAGIENFRWHDTRHTRPPREMVAKGGIEPPTQGFSGRPDKRDLILNQALATHAKF